MAGTEATREAVWLRGLLNAVFNPAYTTFSIHWPIELRGDNQGSFALVNHPQYHQRTKHIELRNRFISASLRVGVMQPD